MAGEIQVNVEPHLCVEWTTEMPVVDDFKRSSVFTVGDNKYSLRVDNEGRYVLALYPTGDIPSPFLVTACLSRGTDLHMPQTTTIEGGEEYYDIWTGEASEVTKFLPDSRERRTCCFRLVFHACRGEQEYPVDKSAQTSSYWDPNSKYETLSREMGEMYHGCSNTDIEFKCGVETFRAHKCLCSCRSKVLKQMFDNEMRESNAGQVLIRDTEPGLFQHFLWYLYTGKLPELSVDIALHLYELGDRYDVSGIRDECRDFLVDNLAPDNACGILNLADRHSDQNFRRCVTDYILEKKIPLFDLYWSDFCKENQQLANEIYGLFVKLHIPM